MFSVNYKVGPYDRCKWSDNPYKWIYKWVAGGKVIRILDYNKYINGAITFNPTYNSMSITVIRAHFVCIGTKTGRFLG